MAEGIWGLKTDQVRKLKELEAENALLRRAVSDLTLDKMILTDAARGNVIAPPIHPLFPRDFIQTR